MGRRGDGNRQPALHRHAAREAQQLDRDLALVVVHGDDGLVVAGLGLEKDRVGRKRAMERRVAGPVARLQRAHCRRDDVDLLAPAGAAIAVVRVEARNRHLGLGHAAGAQRVVEQLRGLGNALLAQIAGHILERHMRGDARSPEIAQRVEFAEVALHAQILGEVVQFVLMAQSAQLHRLLVQGRKADRVDIAGLRRIHALVQHLQHRTPARRADLADLHVGGGNAVDGNKRRQLHVGAFAGVGQAGQRRGGHLHACPALALLPEPGVANQHQIGLLHGFGLGQQPGNQFGANAGRVAQGQGHDGKGCGRHGSVQFDVVLADDLAKALVFGEVEGAEIGLAHGA